MLQETLSFSQGFLSTEQCDNTGASPIFSTDLAPADIYLVPWLKSPLKGWRFCEATDINKNVTEELKRLSQNGFQECFQQL